MRKVLIATPSHDGTVVVWYANALCDSIVRLSTPDLLFMPRWQLGGPVSHVRNQMAKFALDEDVNDLVFIDRDTAWEPDQLARLLSHDVGIVSGVYMKTDGTGQLVLKIPPGAHPRPDGLFPVSAIGAGFLRIRRDALQKLAEGAVRYHDGTKGDIPLIFDVSLPEKGLVSEEVTMVQKFRKLGEQVYADRMIIVRHWGLASFVPNPESLVRILGGQPVDQGNEKKGKRQAVAPRKRRR